jgi:hypothetical protein
MFKAWNSRYNQYNKFSLQHICKNALGKNTSPLHDPTYDSKLVMELYLSYKDDSERMNKFKRNIIGKRASPGFAKNNNYSYQGVCMAAFYPAKCICNNKSLKS